MTRQVANMPQEFPWPANVDRALRAIVELEPRDTALWLRRQLSCGQSDGAIYLLLALASARYVDHHGPLIGHATFNGSPLLRAASLLSRPLQTLALLQMAAYVVDLLHHPNYGPYLLLGLRPVLENTLEESRLQFEASVESGEEPLMAEHRLVGLLLSDNPHNVHHLLTEIALRQFHENEHRLIIVHRTADLMHDVHGWQWAEPLFRPAVQYLASRPAVRTPIIPDDAWDAPAASITDDAMVTAVNHLLFCEYGAEPQILRQYQGWPLAELIALTASEMLCRSSLDVHAVTGIHCILDLLADPSTPRRTRALAVETALLGQRTRRQKAQKPQWHPCPEPRPHRYAAETLKALVLSDHEGYGAMNAVAGALLAGDDARTITQLLMEVALMGSGPFEAIHLVKFIWGQWLETTRSQYPRLAWRHLAAATRVVSQTVAVDRTHAEPILHGWRSQGLAQDGI